MFDTNKCEISKLLELFLYFHGVFTLTPLVRFIHILILADFAFILYFYCVLLTKNKSFVTTNSIIASLMHVITIIFFISVFYKIIGYSSASFGSCVSNLNLYFTIILGWFVIEFSSINQQKRLFWIYSLVVLINVLYNIFVCTVFFDGVDEEHRGQYAAMLGIPNYGGTSFTGYVFFASLAYLILFLYAKNLRERLFSGLMLVVCFYYTIFCGMRGTTAVLFILGLALISTDKVFGGSNNKTIAVNIFIIFAGFIAYLNIEPILQFFIDISPSDRLAKRFNNVLVTMTEGFGDNSLSGRGALFDISIESWTKNIFTILFGIGEPLISNDNTLGGSKYEAAGISGHSDIVDNLAKYGIIGSIILIRGLFLGYAYLKQKYEFTKMRNVVKYLFIILLIYGFVKIMYHDDIFAVMFILLPIIFNFVNNDVEYTKK